MNPHALQVLRTIDKYDRIGPDGVRALLGEGHKDASGAFVEGCKLPPVLADYVMLFFGSKDGSGEHAIDNLAHVLEIGSRFRLIGYLDSEMTEDGRTKWDALCDMRCNQDETWDNGGRPNIAFALEDILKVLRGLQIGEIRS